MENIVNAIGDLFVEGETVNPGNRDQMYKRIAVLQADGSVYSQYAGSLTVEAMENASLAMAKSDTGYRYAIHNLNPFAILGSDAIYDSYAFELELYDEVTRTGNLTDAYLEDKSTFMNLLVNFNRSDDVIGLPQGNDTEYFRDFKTKSTLNDALGNYANGSDRNATRYIFGDARSNLVMGGDGADKLYGGAGNDSLKGTQYRNEDDIRDYMDGGSGDDTYYVGADNPDFFTHNYMQCAT